jgi:hypothetical protein
VSEDVINAWRQAAKDLKIQIQAPFILTVENNDKIRFYLLIENFGSTRGTIILSTDDMTEFDAPEKYGYYYSALNPEHYGVYDRDNFIETLNDWGYYGDKSTTPGWYTGQPWTE